MTIIEKKNELLENWDFNSVIKRHIQIVKSNLNTLIPSRLMKAPQSNVKKVLFYLKYGNYHHVSGDYNFHMF